MENFLRYIDIDSSLQPQFGSVGISMRLILRNANTFVRLYGYDRSSYMFLVDVILAMHYMLWPENNLIHRLPKFTGRN